MTRRGWLLFVALCVIWDPYLLIKVAVREISPASLVFLRTAIGALVLLPLAAARGDLRALLPHWRPIALFTAVEIAMPWLLLADAERRLTKLARGPARGGRPTGRGGDRAAERLPEPLGERRLGGSGSASPSGRPARPGRPRRRSGRGRGDGARGDRYAVGPMVVFRRLTDVPTLDVVAVSLGLGALAYAPVGVAQLPPALPAPEVIGAVVVLGVLCTAVAFVLFFQLIAEVGPVRATVVAYVNPAIAVAAGVALLGEPLTVGTVAGFASILALLARDRIPGARSRRQRGLSPRAESAMGGARPPSAPSRSACCPCPCCRTSRPAPPRSRSSIERGSCRRPGRRNLDGDDADVPADHRREDVRVRTSSGRRRNSSSVISRWVIARSREDVVHALELGDQLAGEVPEPEVDARALRADLHAGDDPAEQLRPRCSRGAWSPWWRASAWR